MDMIPKRIITIWLSEQPTPELVLRCNESKDRSGYEHRLITLDNVYRESAYVNRCIEAKDWVRAVDYLRLHYLMEEGGIYLDADAEMVGDFEDIRKYRMFAFTEGSGYINNGYIGSEAGHPFLSYVTRTMEHNFRFDQNLFLPGMQFFAESYYMADRVGLYMWIFNQSNLESRVKHHAMNSWVSKQ